MFFSKTEPWQLGNPKPISKLLRARAFAASSWPARGESMRSELPGSYRTCYIWALDQNGRWLLLMTVDVGWIRCQTRSPPQFVFTVILENWKLRYSTYYGSYIPSVFDSPTWLPRSTLSSGHLGQADLSGFRACVLLCSLAQLTAPVVTHDPISRVCWNLR